MGRFVSSISCLYKETESHDEIEQPPHIHTHNYIHISIPITSTSSHSSFNLFQLHPPTFIMQFTKAVVLALFSITAVRASLVIAAPIDGGLEACEAAAELVEPG